MIITNSIKYKLKKNMSSTDNLNHAFFACLFTFLAYMCEIIHMFLYCFFKLATGIIIGMFASMVFTCFSIPNIIYWDTLAFAITTAVLYFRLSQKQNHWIMILFVVIKYTLAYTIGKIIFTVIFLGTYDLVTGYH